MIDFNNKIKDIDERFNEHFYFEFSYLNGRLNLLLENNKGGMNFKCTPEVFSKIISYIKETKKYAHFSTDGVGNYKYVSDKNHGIRVYNFIKEAKKTLNNLKEDYFRY